MLNLPQINIQNFNNNFTNSNKNKPQSNANINSTNNKNAYRSQKIKLNSIPLGNLFKHIGEVISNNNINNNENFNHIFSKFNVNSSKYYKFIIDRIEEKSKRSDRPKSKK